MELLSIFLHFLMFSFVTSMQKNNTKIHNPSIYEFISENSYICSPVQLPDGSLITFLNVKEGEKCKECNHESIKFGSACGVRTLGNETSTVSCFEVPPLCIEAFSLRYASSERESESENENNSLENLEEEQVKNVDSRNSTIKSRRNSVFIKAEDQRKSQLRKNQPQLQNNRNKIIFIGTTTAIPLTATTKRICQDKDDLCCFWATLGECHRNPFWMRINCAKTCGTCNCNLGSADICISTGVKCSFTTTPSTTAVPTTIKTTHLTTVSPQSKSTKKKWTRPYTLPTSGFRRTRSRITTRILKNPSTTMLATTTTEPVVTTTTTPAIDSKCKDHYEQCGFWAIHGECRTNPYFMRPNCQKACKSCGERVDTVYAPIPRHECDNGSNLCNYWAFIGECHSNANYMLPNCRQACRVC